MAQSVLPVAAASVSPRPDLSTVPKPVVTGATLSLGWDAFLQRARNINKADLVPSPSTLAQTGTMPAQGSTQSTPVPYGGTVTCLPMISEMVPT